MSLSQDKGLLKVKDGHVILTDYCGDYTKANIHFVVLKYEGDEEMAKKTFKRICRRYDLGETWFLRGKSDANSDLFYIISASLRPFPWSRYRKMLFYDGIDSQFKDLCLKRKCGFIDLSEIDGIIFKLRVSKRSNLLLRQALSALIPK